VLTAQRFITRVRVDMIRTPKRACFVHSGEE
jgi:hypothetical protein